MDSVRIQQIKRKPVDITILIPIYNAEAYLSQCLNSIMSTQINLEIICLNDGSTDSSLDLIQEHAQKDSRIVVINKHNEGYGATLNKGIELARGRYIGVLEPDDYIEGEMYSNLFALAQIHDYPDVVKSSYWAVRDSESKKRHCSYWKRIKPATQPFLIGEAPLLMRYHPSIWSAIYRKSFLVDHDIRFKEVPGAGWVDNPFMAETLLKASSIAYTDKAYYCYRDNHTNSSTSEIADLRMPIDRWNEMTDIFEELDITNDEIMGIHAYRAFYNLEAARQSANFNETEWVKLAKNMMLRIDPQIVSSSPYISAHNKLLYEKVTGISLPRSSQIPYYFMFSKKCLWKLKQVGFAECIGKLRP